MLPTDYENNNWRNTGQVLYKESLWRLSLSDNWQLLCDCGIIIDAVDWGELTRSCVRFKLVNLRREGGEREGAGGGGGLNRLARLLGSELVSLLFVHFSSN